MPGLKGLTAQDRADWEKKFASQLQGRSSEEIENAWRNWNFKQKFGSRDDFSTLKQLSAQEKEDYWNKAYDDSINKIKQNQENVKKQQSLQSKEDLQPLKVESDVIKSPQDDPVLRRQEELKLEAPEYKAKSEAYLKARMQYDQIFKQQYIKGVQAEKNVKEVAMQTSPYYKKYHDTDYLNGLNWEDISKDYNARKDTYGEENANAWLNGKLKDTASKNQSTFEKWFNGFLGVGAGAYATLVNATAGFIKGNYDYFSGEHKDVKGINFFMNYLDAILDNSVTRYTDDVVKYGNIGLSDLLYGDDREGTLANAKKIGLSDLEVVQTVAQESGAGSLYEAIFNENFLPNTLSQYGFTLGSMLTGAAWSKLTNWGFRGIKGMALTNRIEQTGETLMQARKSLDWIRRAENATNRYVIPGVVGTYEGMMEGLQTKMQVLEDGKQMIASKQSQEVDKRFKELVEEQYNQKFNDAMSKASFYKDREGKMVSNTDPNQVSKQILDELYQQAWDEYSSQYAESLDQLEANATRAGIINFGLNSVINGGINSTLKASLFSPSVTGQLKQTKLGKLLTPRPSYRVVGEGAEATVEAFTPWWKTGWKYISEPFGESLEEGAQSLSDAFSRGGATNNLARFIASKYDGDGSMQVGQMWADQFTLENILTIGGDAYGAGQATIDQLKEKDFYLSMISGALTSTMGGVHKISRARQADGTKGSIFNPLSYLQRGTNADGTKETNLEMIARLTPWRSGVVQAHREIKAERKLIDDEAEALTEWIRDPQNRAKYDGLVGSFSWAKQMQQNADGNDEFGYRNSVLGKTINDAIMLNKLRGTEYYDSFMEQLQEVTMLDEDAEKAAQYIDIMRNNVATKDAMENKSDEEIIQQLKDNANKLLQTMSDIQSSTDKIEDLLGNIDEDTKQALVFGELQIKNWQERAQQLQEEISNIDITNSVETTTLNKKQQRVAAAYGSINNAIKQRDKLEKSISTLQDKQGKVQKDIDNLQARKNILSGREKNILAQKKEQLRQQKNQIKSLEKSLSDFEAIETLESEDLVLSEQDILNLDPQARAYMLNPKNKGKYSAKQQQVIDNLIQNATLSDTNFLNKIKDAGRIDLAMVRYLQDYNDVLMDPQSFNIYSRLAKEEANKVRYKARYDSIKKIDNYSDFAKEMDKLLVDANPLEKANILKWLKADESSRLEEEEGGQSFYSQYTQHRDKVAEILNSAIGNPILQEMNNNDINMFTHAITYLTEQDIDPEDIDQTTQALTEMMPDGSKTRFEQYVDDINANTSDAVKTEFTSVGEVIQSIREVLGKYQHDVQEQDSIDAPIIIGGSANTPSDSSSASPDVTIIPSIPTTPQAAPPGPGVFATAATSQEQADQQLQATQEQEVQLPPAPTIPDVQQQGQQQIQQENQSQQQQQQQQQAQQNTIAQYKRNSSEEVADAAQIAINMLNNEQDNLVGLQEARQAINDLSTGEFNTIQDYVDAINSNANQLDISGNKDAADILKNISRKLTAVQSLKEAQQKRQQTLEQQKVKAEQAKQELIANNPLFRAGLNSGILDSRNSNNMQTIDIQKLKKSKSSNPAASNYSPLLKYIEDNHIEQYLQDHNIDRNTPVFFVSDSTLRKEQQQLWEQGGYTYTADDFPLIAVIQDNNGPIEITNPKTGETLKYQPIGIMPSTGNNAYLGSNRLKSIRENINTSADGVNFILDNGNPIETRLSNNIKAEGTQHFASPEQNASIQELEVENMTSDERQQYLSQNKKAKRSTQLYQQFRNRFFSKVVAHNYVTKRGETKLGAFYQMETLVPQKDGTTIQEYQIMVQEAHLLKARDNESTLSQVFANNDIQNALHFNSRIERFLLEVNKTLSSLDFSSLTYNSNGKPTQNTIKEISKLENTLDLNAREYLRPRDMRFTLTATSINGNPVLKLQLEGVYGTIELGILNTNSMNEQQQYNMLKNMFVDANNEVRMISNSYALIQFNVNYHNLAVAGGINTQRDGHTPLTSKEKTAATLDAYNVFDDGLLTLNVTRTTKEVTGVTIEAPYAMTGQLRQFPTVVTTNKDNANTNGTLNQPVVQGDSTIGSNGAIINTDTGNAVVGTAPTPVLTEAGKRAAQIANQIVQDSQQFSITEDEEHYQDQNQNKFSRVTDIIAANNDNLDSEGRPVRFDPNNPWAVPSTNIGTGVDEFTRGFFEGRIVKTNEGWKVDGKNLSDVYPNATENSLQRFADQLNVLKNNLTSQDITIIPREVICSGQLVMQDSNGQSHTINVAGTLDLLGYDQDGNWHIYDMKTLHNASSLPSKEPKYRRQMTLYKTFLEQKYGIKVTDINVIPIEVSYNTPLGASYKGKRGTTNYTVKAGPKPEGYTGREQNQLMVNPNSEFKGSSPHLFVQGGYKKLDFLPINVNFDNLTDMEKQAEVEMKDSIEKAMKAQDPSVDSGNPSVILPEGTGITVVANQAEEAPIIDTTTNTIINEEQLGSNILSQFGLEGIDMSQLEGMNVGTLGVDAAFIPQQFVWGQFNGFTNTDQDNPDSFGKTISDINQTIANLEKAGWTKEKFDALPDSLKEQELNCKGIF